MDYARKQEIQVLAAPITGASITRVNTVFDPTRSYANQTIIRFKSKMHYLHDSQSALTTMVFLHMAISAQEGDNAVLPPISQMQFARTVLHRPLDVG